MRGWGNGEGILTGPEFFLVGWSFHRLISFHIVCFFLGGGGVFPERKMNCNLWEEPQKKYTNFLCFPQAWIFFWPPCFLRLSRFLQRSLRLVYVTLSDISIALLDSLEPLRPIQTCVFLVALLGSSKNYEIFPAFPSCVFDTLELSKVSWKLIKILKNFLKILRSFWGLLFRVF